MAEVVRGLLIGNRVYWSERTNTREELEDEFRDEIDDCDGGTISWRAYPPNDNYLADLSEWSICCDGLTATGAIVKYIENTIRAELINWRRKMVILPNESRRVFSTRIFACYGRAICVGDSEVIVREGGAAHVFDRTRCVARDNAIVFAYDQSIVDARDNAQIVAYDQSVVETRDKAYVVADNHPTIVSRNGFGAFPRHDTGDANLFILPEAE